MEPLPPAPPISLDPGEVIVREWLIPWERLGIESVTRFVLTNQRLVVHCVFTRAGWMAGKKQRELVDLGHWQDTLNANLEALADPTTGSQGTGIGSLTDLMIGGRPVLILSDANRPIVEGMLPEISRQRAIRLGLGSGTESPDPRGR